jgi:nucleoside recognition membrane protein YjiH
VLATAAGLAFFAVPLPLGGRWTVLFDHVVSRLTAASPAGVQIYCLALIVAGALLTHVALFWPRRLRPAAPAGNSAAPASPREPPRASPRAPAPSLPTWLRAFHASPGFAVLRLCGVPLAVMLYFGIGPAALRDPAVGGLLWGTLVMAVAVIIPVGAVALSLLAAYGGLEFVGVLMRPVMRPLYRLPGRAALDNLTSWLGSYSVGLYLTRRLYDQGRYSRREAFIIATGFSTVSVGFVAVVADTLDLLPLFPLIFGAYFVAVYLVAIIQVRLWPTTAIAQTYKIDNTGKNDKEIAAIGTEQPEVDGEAADEAADQAADQAVYAAADAAADGPGRLRRAWALARSRAAAAPPPHRVAASGFADGLRLASTLLGTILAVGTVALLLATHTPLFALLGRPLEPILSLLGLPDAARIAPACVAGVAEMYLPALLAQGAAVEARFFVAVLSVSQLVFFSSVAPMMMDLFADVPIRARHLLALFALRTALLVPLLAGLTAALCALGVFEGVR